VIDDRLHASNDVGNSKGILETIFLAAVVANQLLPVSAQSLQSSDFLAKDITGKNDVEFKKVSEPFRILIISFLAFDCLDILRGRNDDMAGIFQDIKYKNPVFAGGFHVYLNTAIAKGPFFRDSEVGIEGGETFLFISSNATEACESDDGDHNFCGHPCHSRQSAL
jgi:hypothetical protein